MIRAKTPLFLLFALGLAACSAPDIARRPSPTNGNGPAFGAIFGAQTDGNAGTATKGPAVLQLDRQAQALKSAIQNKNIEIVNTGKMLIVTLPGTITFDTGSTILRDSLRGDLLALAKNLRQFPQSSVDILGHTDNVGAAAVNRRLSIAEADAVFNSLLENGIAAGRMRTIGRGESAPLTSNLTAAGRTKNRRIEIIIRPKSRV